jgi:hypothetical protein
VDSFADLPSDGPQGDEKVIESLRRQAAGGAPDAAFPELTMPCKILSVGTANKRNGATYVVLFEVPVYNASAVLMMHDGIKVTFMDQGAKSIIVGKGAFIASSASSRDTDGVGHHYKIKLQFAQSELASVGPLNKAIVNGGEGTLKLEAEQGSLDLG